MGTRGLWGLRAGGESEKDKWGLAVAVVCLGEWLSGTKVGPISSLAKNNQVLGTDPYPYIRHVLCGSV